MRRASGEVTRDKSEVVVGEDEFKLPVVECPEVKLGRFGKYWERCPECKEDIFHEVNGKEYYHKLACKHSNGVGYGGERTNQTLPHHPQCDCMTCEPPKEKK
jgi:hypothetical protein